MSITGPPVENLDKSKGLWRAAYVLIKKLDTVYHGGKAIKTVFSYEAYGHRLRLKELLQKLMFMDLGTNFRRTEELIWRKAFYEPYFLYKVYIKNNDQQDRIKLFENMLVVHILSAIGYYQSLILAFQSELGDTQSNNLCSWIPIALHIPLYCGVFFEFEEKHNPSVENKSAVIKLIHKCLTNIGDLFRYLIDFGDSNAKRLAYRYYKAAFYFDPLMGLPHNQLGILDVGRCYGLNAVFHYLRCLTSRSPFEGAKGNLITVLAKNELRYGIIIREKPSKSSRIRYASYFRSRDPATENIFHDVLAELHSSLLLTDHLTVRSESITYSEHTNTKYLKMGEVKEKPDRVDETSDQLTGPIFIRMLLISILTYEYIHQLNLEDRNKSSGKKLDENSNIESDSPQQSEITSASTSLMTGEEEKAIQIDSSDNCSSAVTNKCESSSLAAIPDLYEPLSFALSIGELYLTHVCRQIYYRLGQFMEDPKRKPNNSGISTNSYNLCIDCPVCSDPSNPSENLNCKHILNDQPLPSNVSSTEHPEAMSELVNPDDELDDSGDVKCTRTSSHESIHSNTDNDEDHARLRFRRYSSDEDSEHEFVERGTDENDNDSDTDFWGSDDSSLLHSQDEINSTGTSSDDDLDVLSDDRLRRASKLNHMGSQRDVKQLKHNDSSKYLSESRSVSKDVRSTLTCISEEEAIQEGKTEEVEVPSLVSHPSSDNAKESVRHDSTTDYVEKNVRYSSKCHSDSIKENLSDYPSVQFDKDSYDPNTDIPTRISLFSRLYLFPAVKLFLDWLSSSQFQHLNLSFQNVNSTLTDNITNKSQKPSRASIIWQASVERFVSQLIPLLNSIYPIFDQMSHEILCKNVTDTSESCEISHCDKKEQLHVDSCTHLVESNTDDKTKFNIVHHLSPAAYRTMKKLFSQQIFNPTKFPVEEQNESEKNFVKETVIPNDEKSKIYPLPEDWLLLGLPSMNCIHKKIDFHNGCISPSLNEVDEINSTEIDQSRRDQAMRDMARLRLLNEVDQLERQFRNQSPLSYNKRSTNTASSMQNSDSNIQDKNLEFDIKKTFLSPFLVIDAYCLTSHLSMVKQLVSSNRFVLIIPQAVISHLDYLKKTMASARVAIRYLEHEAHGGNRYLRLQRPDEQPNQLIELHRQDAVHNDAQDLINDTEEDEPKAPTNQSLNLRVVRRWINILNCASYFAQTLKDSNNSSDPTSVNKNSLLKEATNSNEQETNDFLYLLNISPPYVDLLNKDCSTNELNVLSLTKTAPVTILIGFRNTSVEDTIVPQDFLKLALNHGVRLELIRSFIQRWKAIKT
ncbi:unnamed protein product [Schistosoma haematobium]|nr:unnamed protein product [Schistosoma haematobium]